MSTATATPSDERVARVGLVRALLVKPVFGSVIGAVVSDWQAVQRTDKAIRTAPPGADFQALRISLFPSVME